jgi:AraC-like DNA-binding protein
MKATFQKILINEQTSFIAKQLDLPRFDSEYHFHPEFELKYVIQSRGKRFVGESIENFMEGDLVLLGPNIPHYWKNDPIYYKTEKLKASAFLVMFSDNCLGNGFFSLPEMVLIKELFNKAKGGICFNSEYSSSIPNKLKRLISVDGPLKIIGLIEILLELSNSQTRPLLTENFIAELPSLNKDISVDRLKRVHEFVIANFHNKIKIEDVAERASMTTYAFCKYFKKSTKKTFITFLIELRICHAKKLLIENLCSISEICYASGFDNLSNFNRAFKSLARMTPKEYRKFYNP